MTTTKKEHPPILQELFKDTPELLDHPNVTALLEYVKEQHKLTVSQTMKYQTAYFDIINKCFQSDVFVIGGKESSEVIKDIIKDDKF